MADWNSLIDDPLFNAGLGLLGGASTGNPWGAAADQLNKYQTLRQNREYQRMHAKVYEAQALKAQQEAEQAARAQQNLNAALPNIPEHLRGFIAADPKLMGDYAKTLPGLAEYKHEQYFDPNSGHQFYGLRAPTSTSVQPVGGIQQDINTPGELQSKLTEQQTLLPGKLAIAGASAARNTVVLPPLEKAENTEVGKGLGETYNKLQAAGLTAPARIERAKQMASYLEGYNTGKLTPAGVEIASALKSMGYNIDPNLPNKQAAISLTNQMAMEARNPASGGGLPGATSDSDRNFLVDTVANIGKDPGANRRWIDAQIKLAKRDQDVARLAREYRKKNGTLEGFPEYIGEWANKPENQLFPSGKKTPNITIRSLD